jgi:hypothetical protein
MHATPARGLILAVLGALAQGASGDEAPTPRSVEAAVPGLAVRSVAAVPALPGIYEVIDEEGRFLYVDAHLRVAIMGELFDIATHQSSDCRHARRPS